MAVMSQNIPPRQLWPKLVPFPNAWQGSRLWAYDNLLTREASTGIPMVLYLGLFSPWGRGKV